MTARVMIVLQLPEPTLHFAQVRLFILNIGTIRIEAPARHETSVSATREVIISLFWMLMISGYRTKLKEQLAILDAQPEAGMVYGATEYWHSWTGNREDDARDYVPDLGIQADTLVKPPTLLTRYLESKALTPCPSDILLRREILKHVGGFEENFSGVRQLYEDQAFLAKVYLTTPVFVASNCWDKYRLHPDSCVSRVERANLKYDVGLFYLQWLEKYLAKEGIENREIHTALRDKRWRYRRANLQCRHETLFRLWRGACHVLRQMQPELRKQW